MSIRRETMAFAAVCTLVLLTRLLALSRPLWVDETPILLNVATFLQQRTIIPPHFSYPPLFSYLATPTVGVAAVAGGWSTGLGPRDWALVDGGLGSEGLVLGPRMLSVAFSLLTVAALWWTTRPFSLRWRVVGAAAFAFSPEAVRYGAMALPDVAAGAMALVAVGLALRAGEAETPSSRQLRLFLQSGCALGAAAAFKYNAALAAPAIALAAWNAARSRRAWVLAGSAGVASLLAFGVLAPTWVLTPGAAWEGFLFESRNVQRPRLGEPAVGFFRLAGRFALQEPGWFLATFGTVWAVALKRDLRMFILAIPPVLNLLVVSTWGKQDVNYLLPTLGIAALGAAWGLRHLVKKHDWLVAGLFLMLCVLGWIGGHPFPPWVEQRAAESISAQFPEGAEVIRLGLHTPKVWDEAEVQEFVTGRGQSLSPQALQAWERRRAEQPHAVRVFTSVLEWRGSDPDSSVTQTVVVVTDRYLKRLTNATDAELAESEELQESARLARELLAGEWGEPVRYRGGEGWEMLVFGRRKPVTAGGGDPPPSAPATPADAVGTSVRQSRAGLPS